MTVRRGLDDGEGRLAREGRGGELGCRRGCRRQRTWRARSRRPGLRDGTAVARSAVFRPRLPAPARRTPDRMPRMQAWKPAARGGRSRTATPRRRLCEALPSALSTMNGLPTCGEGMSVARDGNGGRARRAESEDRTRPSTTAGTACGRGRSGRGWPSLRANRQYGARAGTDLATNGDGRFGVSSRGLQGSAEMSGSGSEMELSGVDAGVHGMAFLGDNFHNGRAGDSVRRQADLRPERGFDGRRGRPGLRHGPRGRTEAGGGLAATPAIGLARSEASLDFAETINGQARERVSAGGAPSLMWPRLRATFRTSGRRGAWTRRWRRPRRGKPGTEIRGRAQPGGRAPVFGAQGGGAAERPGGFVRGGRGAAGKRAGNWGCQEHFELVGTKLIDRFRCGGWACGEVVRREAAVHFRPPENRVEAGHAAFRVAVSNGAPSAR